ncbi:Xylan 1 4-beta-xylosidase, partial [termite gut metagenome]
MKKLQLIAWVVIAFLSVNCCGDIPVYKNSSKPVEKRVKDLLKRMT